MRRCEHADDLVGCGGKRPRGFELTIELLELAPGRQLAVQQQMAGLLEDRALGEVVDGVASIQQFTRAAVDKAYARAVEDHTLQAAMDFRLVALFVHCPSGNELGRPKSDSCTIETAACGELVREKQNPSPPRSVQWQGCNRTRTTVTFFTIGHSTRPIEAFIDLLQHTQIAVVADVRTVPRSRTNPQYDRYT